MTDPGQHLSDSPGADASPPKTPATSSRERRPRAVMWLRLAAARYAILIALAVLYAGFAVALPTTFATSGNLVSMLVSQGVFLILALAVTLPLRVGDFDLSIGSTAVTGCIMVAVLTSEHGWNSGTAIVATVAFGLLIGVVNGFFIVIVELPAFLATLGMMTLLSGVGYAISGNQIVTGVGSGVVELSQRELFGLPLLVYIGWLLACALWYVYEFVPFGRYLVFVGGNPEAARLSGVSVRWTRFSAFVIAAGMSAFAGVLLAGQLGAADPSIGPQYLLPPYAAAFLGTTTVQIGRFNTVGTIVALYLLTIGITGLQLLGAPTWISNVFNGGALLAAVSFAKIAERSVGRA